MATASSKKKKPITPSPSLSKQTSLTNYSNLVSVRLSTATAIYSGRTVMGKAHQVSIMGARPSKLGRMIGGGRGKRFKRLNGSSAMAAPPRGYVPVCVGVNDETKRFIVHTTLLSEGDFLELLCRAAEEYGFCNEGVLRIPYEAKDFEEWVVERGKKTRVKPAYQSRAVCFSRKRVQVFKWGLKSLRSC